MNSSWVKKNGLAKLATLSAVVFLISLGLCGANEALFSRYGAISGGEPMPPRSSGASMLLIATGLVELTGIFLGGLGLIVAGIAGTIAGIQKLFVSRNSED